MGIDVRLENQAGEEIESLVDLGGSLAKIILECELKCSPTLRFIDPLGTSLFNRLQIPHLIREIELAREQLADQKAVVFAEDLLALARRCRDEVNTYLKFHGG